MKQSPFSCIGKVRFASWADANRVVTRGNGREKRRSVYRCDHCGGFHVGSHPSSTIRLKDRRLKQMKMREAV